MFVKVIAADHDFMITTDKIYHIVGENYEFFNDFGVIYHFKFPNQNLKIMSFVDIWEEKRNGNYQKNNEKEENKENC